MRPDRGERIDVRLSAELKSLLGRAAAHSRMSLTGFLVSAATQKAQELLAERERLTLSARDSQAFLAALDKPARRRPRLERALKRYVRRRGA
jgi:uncharacterized protein (DUF1778 family)